MAHNYAKVFLTLGLRLGTALPARPFILYCGSTPRIGSLAPGLRITGSLGQVAVAGMPETKPSWARTLKPLLGPHPLTFHWLNLVTWLSSSSVGWSSSSSHVMRHMLCYAKSLPSCPSLCDPIDSSLPGSPVPGIVQARTLEWVAISFSNV